MLDIIETLQAVSENLKELFEDKGELRGFHDWDVLIGCVIALERVIVTLQTTDAQTEGDENVTDGE